jgi:hypothetical protein
MSRSFPKVWIILALIGLALALGGCREEELGRPLFYDKGKYQGTADEPLPSETVEQLRQRVRGQGAGGL